jgi:hypothetical protein
MLASIVGRGLAAAVFWPYGGVWRNVALFEAFCGGGYGAGFGAGEGVGGEWEGRVSVKEGEEEGKGEGEGKRE